MHLYPGTLYLPSSSKPNLFSGLTNDDQLCLCANDEEGNVILVTYMYMYLCVAKKESSENLRKFFPMSAGLGLSFAKSEKKSERNSLDEISEILRLIRTQLGPSNEPDRRPMIEKSALFCRVRVTKSNARNSPHFSFQRPI